jgi:PAS domain-containing protein
LSATCHSLWASTRTEPASRSSAAGFGKTPTKRMWSHAGWGLRGRRHSCFRDLSAQKAAEAALRCQAALATHVSDAIIATTFAGIVTNWNPAAEAIYRRPAIRALALPASEAVGAPLDPAAIIADGGIVHSTHHAADGAALAVRVSATATDNGYVLVCTDQTALRHAEQHFQTVVNTLDYGVAVVGSDGYVESSNPAAHRIFGTRPEVLKNRPANKALDSPIYDTNGQGDRFLNLTSREAEDLRAGSVI